MKPGLNWHGMKAQWNKIWKKEVTVMNNKRKFRNISDAGNNVNNIVREITSADGIEGEYLRRLR